MKVAESPHTTSLHPQKDMHHKSQGMTENHPENVAMVILNKSVIMSSSGFQTYESYMHEK
jgi:hypothetical protein